MGGADATDGGRGTESLPELLERLNTRDFPLDVRDRFLATPEASFEFLAPLVSSGTLRPRQEGHALRMFDYLRHYGDRKLVLDALCDAAERGRRPGRSIAVQMLIKTLYRSAKSDWDLTEAQRARLRHSIDVAVERGVWGDTERFARVVIAENEPPTREESRG